MRDKLKQSLLDFIDGYKYDSAKLLEDLTSHPDLQNQFRKFLEPVGDQLGWPREFRTWQGVLLAILGNEIGGIASPMLRDRAAKRLFDVATSVGITPPMLNMITSDPYRVRRAVESVD